MRNVVRAGSIATLAVVGVLGGCKRSSQHGTPPSTATVASSATPVASAPPKVRPITERTCKLGTPVVANEGRGGNTFGVAGTAKDIVVTWGELRAPAPGFGPDDAKQRYEMARTFDAATLAPRAPAKMVGVQEAVDAFSNGVAPFALDGGTIGSATCAWAAFAGHLTCNFDTAAGSPLAAALYDDRAAAGPGPQGDRVAAAGVGGAALMILPQCQDVRIYSSAGKPGLHPLVFGSAEALGDCEPKHLIEVPALAARSDDEALGVWRHAGVIEGRQIGKDGMPRGNVVKLSGAPGDVGAPALARVGDAMRVTWASRKAPAPYALAWAKWSPGAPVTATTLATGSDPSMAPALAPTDDPRCVLVSWTEGKGSATHVRAGLACDDALVAGSVIDVSGAGVEAGDSELARGEGSNGVVVWQELPKGKGAELKLAKIICE